MVRQFKETSIEGKRLLHLGMAACMLMLVMVICHAEPVFAKNFEMDLDANKVTYTNVVNLSPKALIFQGYRALFFLKNF